MKMVTAKAVYNINLSLLYLGTTLSFTITTMFISLTATPTHIAIFKTFSLKYKVIHCWERSAKDLCFVKH